MCADYKGKNRFVLNQKRLLKTLLSFFHQLSIALTELWARCRVQPEWVGGQIMSGVKETTSRALMRHIV